MKYIKQIMLFALLFVIFTHNYAQAQYYIHRIAGCYTNTDIGDSAWHGGSALIVHSPGGSICLDDTGNMYVGGFWSGVGTGGVTANWTFERIEYATDSATAYECSYYSSIAPSTYPIYDSCLFIAGMCFDTGYNNLMVEVEGSNIRKINISTGAVTTIAGSYITAGFSGDGGPATAALLTAYALTTDTANNLYFSDWIDNRIRMIDAVTGIITTIAGNGSAAYSGDGGQATAASLNSPLGIHVTKKGDLYIADHYNHCIRMVNLATGIISTVAGTDSAGFTGDGGPATAAELNKPCAVNIDASGNMYIADLQNLRVRKVNTLGIITTIAGNGTSTFCDTAGDNGPATDAPIAPYSIDIDKYGNIFVGEGGEFPYYHAPWGTVEELTLTPVLTGNITGKDTVCATKQDTLSTTLKWTGNNGVWSVTNSNATINTIGVVTGVDAGIDTVVYTVTNDSGISSQTTYPVYIASKAHCDSISEVPYVLVNQLSDVLVYPNPVSSQFSVISFQFPELGGQFGVAHCDIEGTIKLMDITGRVLQVAPVSNAVTTLNIGGYVAGVYLYRVMTQTIVQTGKVVING